MPDPAVGERFPTLRLLTQGNQTVRVPEDFQGRNVILSWFPFSFSPVCTEELGSFAKVHTEFQHLNATVVAVSCDHWYSNEAYKAKLSAPYPILSDWTKENARGLGILDEAKGRSERVIYLIDKDGVLRWKRHYPILSCPHAEDFLGELKKLA